jgi:hypothetical protein
VEDLVDFLPKDTHPYETLRPVLTEMCKSFVFRQNEFACPFTLMGLVWGWARCRGGWGQRPIGQGGAVFNWPEHPTDTQVCSSGVASQQRGRG